MSEKDKIALVIIGEAQKLLPPPSMDQVIKSGTSDYLDRLPTLAQKLSALGWKIAHIGDMIKEKQEDPVPGNEARYLEWISFHLSNAEDSLESGYKMLEKLSGYMNTSMTLGELLEDEE